MNLIVLRYINQAIRRAVIMVQNSAPTNVIEPLDIPILLRSWLGGSGQECYIIESLKRK